jgi:hypothetical protein
MNTPRVGGLLEGMGPRLQRITRACDLKNESYVRDLLPRGTDDTQLPAYGAERRDGS